MQIHLSPITETELAQLMPLRARYSVHTLTDDPAGADLILLLGGDGQRPDLLVGHPIYRAYPDKCAIYTEDDCYLPLVPGIYCSARMDEHSRAGRVFAWSYVSARGNCTNPFVGKADTPKSLLFSFQGGSTSILRKRMFNLAFNRPDILIENTSAYHHWDPSQPGRERLQQSYAETIGASHFVLCPRGAGTGSIRLFEVMQAGVAPVLISDDYPLPPGVPWETFLLRVAEKDIHRLPELIEPHRRTSAERGRLAREAWRNHFAPEKEFDAIVALAATALRHGPPNETVFRLRQRRMIARAKILHSLRRFARTVVLKALGILHIKLPYQMNR